MKKKILILTAVMLCLFGFSCDDGEPEYKSWDPASIQVDSATLLNIIGKWHLITEKDIINNIIIVDSNEAIVFLENGDYGIETNNTINLKENSYYKVGYGGIYYINKQNNKIDSMRDFSYDDKKDRLGLWYKIPKSSWGCTTYELGYKIKYYIKMEE